MENNLGFGLVFGRLAALKISDWTIKYATFEGNFLMISWEKTHHFTIVLTSVFFKKWPNYSNVSLLWFVQVFLK